MLICIFCNACYAQTQSNTKERILKFKLTYRIYIQTKFNLFPFGHEQIIIIRAENWKYNYTVQQTWDTSPIYLVAINICLPAEHVPVFHGLCLPVQGSGDFPRFRLRHRACFDRHDDNVPVHLYAVQWGMYFLLILFHIDCFEVLGTNDFASL